jgi:hypothetical protein
MEVKINKIYRDFHLSDDEYHKHRNNLDGSHYVVSKETWFCRVLYFDGDGGVALFTNPCEIFVLGGFEMKLIDCSYCDVSLEAMSEILQVFHDFVERIDRQKNGDYSERDGWEKDE